MNTIDNELDISTALEVYIISNEKYILKRTVNHKIDYFYCSIKKAEDLEGNNTIRGRIKDNKLIVFERSSFYYEITIDDMKKIEYKKLY